MKQIYSNWYRAKSELPKNDMVTVAITDGFDCTTGFFNFRESRWFVNDITAVQPAHVKYWIYLPEEHEDE